MNMTNVFFCHDESIEIASECGNEIVRCKTQCKKCSLEFKEYINETRGTKIR